MTGSAEGAPGATMAEGPEEARSHPPGQDGGGGDREQVPSGPGSPAAANAAPRPPTVASAVSKPEPQQQCELRKRRDAGAEPQEPGGCEASDAPGRLSAREYSRQVHEWLWQSYCGYLTWHSGLAALPTYCGPPPAAPQPAVPPPPQPPPPPPPQLAYYNPFYFLSAAGPGPGAATGGATPTAVAGLTARAPHVQASARAAPVTRVGSAAPARTASDTGRQAGENGGLAWVGRV